MNIVCWDFCYHYKIILLNWINSDNAPILNAFLILKLSLTYSIKHFTKHLFSHGPIFKYFQAVTVLYLSNKVADAWVWKGSKLPVDMPNSWAGGIKHAPAALPDLETKLILLTTPYLETWVISTHLPEELGTNGKQPSCHNRRPAKHSYVSITKHNNNKFCLFT